MIINHTSALHTFSLDDLTGSTTGAPADIDLTESVVPAFTDKDGNVLYAVDSTLGFYVTDFIGAEDKVFDGDYAEGFAGNVDPADDPNGLAGLAVRNAKTDLFKSGAPLGTWSLGLGGQTVKASTEHYSTMSQVLSDQAYPGDPDAIGPLDDDLRILDLRPDGLGGFDAGALHQLWLEELTQALQTAIDNVGTADQVLSDIDFDRDMSNDTYRITTETIDYDSDGDGVTELTQVGAVDLGNDGTIDLMDKPLNGIGAPADIADVIDPNEASITYDIAYSQDYSITVKDDGKLLYRFGEAVKRPNDIRMEVNLDLPDDWTADADNSGVADGLEGDGFAVTKAELVIRHNTTNNPNDQVRPEDYENEAAIGRLPSHIIVDDPDNPGNTLWVSPVDSYNGEGEALYSYFKLDANGNIDALAGGQAVTDPDGNFVGYRNEDADGNFIGTVLKDDSLAALADAADLEFASADLAEGFTANWYTTVDREPFEWSYDKFPDNPYINIFESFHSPEDAAQEGYSNADLVSGPRWRLTPNKFGQDLPGLEVPIVENSPPPYQRDNIKYPTGEFTTTTLNLLDWNGDSPLASSVGWMAVDRDRLDENRDGLIDEGWSDVNGSLGHGDALPTGLILTATSPNGVVLESDVFDTSVYIKGDRQDSANIYDIQLNIEYERESPVIGAVQEIDVQSQPAQQFAFQDGAIFDNPVVFMPSLSYLGRDVANVTVESVTDSGVSVYVQEADYLDQNHRPETATMITMEEGSWELADGSRIEVGTTEVAAGSLQDFHSVTFADAFDEAPTVLVQVQTNNDTDWAVVRLSDVTTTGFEFILQEEEASDQVLDSAEIVGWMAVDAADTSDVLDFGDLTAQAFFEEDLVNHYTGDVALDAALGLDPLVAGLVASFNGADAVATRLKSVSNDGTSATATFIAQEDRSADNEIGHIPEDISGMAFESAGLLRGEMFVDDILVA